MIYLIGNGGMSKEYIKILSKIKIPFKIIGNSVETCKLFMMETGLQAIPGGDQTINEMHFEPHDKIIIAVPVERLLNTTNLVLQSGGTAILTEKPVGLYLNEIEALKDKAKSLGAKIYAAYNRRFYSSVIVAQSLINDDGGIQSISFDFTEWSDEIAKIKQSEVSLNRWVLSNSSHVLDLAFYFAGRPIKMSSHSSGVLNWHESSTFCGAGITDRNVLFNYCANWDSAGRWRLELHTKKRKLVFSPMEQLHVVERGSIALNKIAVDDRLDQDFKPGLYLQTEAFLNEKAHNQLCSLDDHVKNFTYYQKIAGYKP